MRKYQRIYEPIDPKIKVKIDEKKLIAIVTGTLNPITAMKNASIAARNCHPKLQITGWPIRSDRRKQEFIFELFFLLPQKDIFDF